MSASKRHRRKQAAELAERQVESGHQANVLLAARLLGAVAILLATLFLIFYLNGEMNAHSVACGDSTLGGSGGTSFIASCFVIDVPGRKLAYLTDKWRYIADLNIGLLGIFLAALVSYPSGLQLLAALRRRWPFVHAGWSAAAGATFLSAFIVFFGNRQFGGYDDGNILESGWRLIQGQVPYRDYICTLPPGVFLGVKFAFALFGVRWISTLMFTAIFASGCFVWMYLLFRALLGSRTPAFLSALCILSVSMLPDCFWWYNEITSVAATIFLLSCLLYLKEDGQRWPQWSYAASLCLLGFMKPNTAGVMIVAGVVLLLAVTPDKAELLLWTAAAAALNIIVLTVNHVSVSGLLSSYIAAAQGRRPLHGFLTMAFEEIPRVSIAILFLLAPFAAGWTQFRIAWKGRDRPGVARLFLLLSAAVTSVIAMSSNGDLKDVDWPLLIASGVVLLHNAHVPRPILLRAYACFLCALTVTDIYAGIARYQVHSMGRHRFFEWSGPLVSPNSPFFTGMRASPMLMSVMDEMTQVLKDAPRPVYFGPRLTFAYAAFAEPSPKNLPVWWEPNTAFAKSRESALEETWRNKHLATVILLGRDTSYFSPAFTKSIDSLYQVDPRWQNITVLRRKPE